MKRLTLLFMFFVIPLTIVQPLNAAEIDMNSVTIRGDSANYGMWINSFKEYDYGFKVITTGAEFVFEKNSGTMKMYQRIGAQRFVGQVTFGDRPQEIRMYVNTPDHVLFEATDFFIGIYGDSTCIVAAKIDNLLIKCDGNFLPEYAGSYEAEVILIDEYGGVALLPQRHEAGYKTLMKLTRQKDWQMRYEFKKGQRIMISVFPPREFNEQQSYMDRIVVTDGYVNNGTLREWRKYTNILSLFNGIYHGRSNWKGYVYPGRPYAYTFGGPYEPTQPKELKRIVETAHSLGFKVCVYTSVTFHFEAPDDDAFFADAAQIYRAYNLDGFYIDGLNLDLSKQHGGFLFDDKIKNYELMRRLRQIVGPDGILYLHGSGDRSEVAAVPNIDALADYTLYAESVRFTSFDDPYIKFQVRKYGISNTIGMIKANMGPDIPEEQMLDQMLKMRNRERWRAYPYRNANGQTVWPQKPPPHVLRYYRHLDALKAGVPLETLLKIPPK